ncbi:MAG: regulatory iron-sulfur-containing complex subunit RicT [Myxococcota bacterium]
MEPLPAQPPEPARDEWGEDLFVDLEPAPPPSGAVAGVCTVRFRAGGRAYEVDAAELSLAPGDRVVVETDRGAALGAVVLPTHRRLAEGGGPPMRVLRRADGNDLRRDEQNERRGAEALSFARARIRERRLDLKVVRCDILHGSGKANFYFSSEARIDFRDLVRELSQRLRLRVELRQIGLRDAAKMIGGIGDCGRELCCTTFLPRFEPISIRMAKDQGLPLNPSRVTGQCGRLKCCLVYEHAQYVEAGKGLPKVGKMVVTPKGPGRVQELDVMRGRVKVYLGEGAMETFVAADVRPAAPPSGPGPGGGAAPPASQPPRS